MADSLQPEPPPPPEVVVVNQTPSDKKCPPPPRQGCLERRSPVEKILLVFLVIVTVLCLSFLAAFLIFYFFASPPEGVCLTEECVKTASYLQSQVDETADPCSNFYQYSCGGWIKAQTLELDKNQVTVDSLQNTANLRRIRGLLEVPVSKEDPDYARQPKIFYKACKNTEKLNERGSVPFLNLMSEVGKFPILDRSWNSTEDRLETLLVQLSRIKIEPLLKIDIERDEKNTAVNRIYISAPSLGLDPPTQFAQDRNNSAVQVYERWLVESLVLLGANQSLAEQDVREMVDLEVRLAQLVARDETKEDNSPTYNPMTVAVLQSRFPWLQWLEFLRGLASSPQPGGGGVYISIEEQTVVRHPDFLEKLGALLGKIPKRTITNYLMSHLLKLTKYLGSDFVALVNKFQKDTLQDSPQDTSPTSRQDLCASQAASTFPDPVSRMFVQKFLPPETQTQIATLTGDLKKSFTEILTENTWMSEEAKQKAKEKINSLTFKIGFPESIMNDDRLNKQYAAIPSKDDQYFETIVALKSFEVSEQFRSLKEPVDKTLWSVPVTSLEIFYDRTQNELVLPAGLLQEPLFSPDYPSAVNFGALGVRIGHEIIHAFDEKGSRYGSSGQAIDWWNQRDKDTFQQRTQCFIDQYGCYKWDGVNLNGERTLSENIADNGGIQQSYRAYRNLVKRLGSEEPRLPGLQLDNNQLFFLSFSQMYCAKFRDEFRQELIDSHLQTPAPYRVLGALQNSREFSEAFTCSSGSRLNPLRKCGMW